VLSQSGGSRALEQEFLERNLSEQGDATATNSIDNVRATYNAMSPTEKEARREPTAPDKSKTQAQAAAKFLREHPMHTLTLLLIAYPWNQQVQNRKANSSG